MNRLFLTGLAALATAQMVLPARAAQTVAWAQRTTVDSDGDGQNDLVDNAPGTPNPDQLESDTDGIGDVIDPTPFNANPSLGDPGLGIFDPLPHAAGSTVGYDYFMTISAPPGGFGHIDLDFGGNGVFDATYFGPLTTNIDQFSVAASLFVDGTWNLNAPGTYTLHARAYGPGMSSQNETISNVTITPEPASFALGGVAAGSLVTMVRRRRRAK